MINQSNKKLNKTISPLISGDQMGQAEEPKAGGEQQVASGKVEKIYNELLKAFEAIKVDPKKDLIIPSIKDNAMKDEIVKMLKFSVPLKDGSSVEDAGVKYTFKNNKWYTLPPKTSSPDETKPFVSNPNISDHYERSHNNRLLKEWEKTESILKVYNIDVKTFLKNVKNVASASDSTWASPTTRIPLVPSVFPNNFTHPTTK